MKLQRLELQAFGPFADQQEINFSDLGDNPLFLIDGPTGAGKSSILHAICFALYGETTDADRKTIGLRCDHADVNVLTQVTLEFSIRNQAYKISRIPSQMRPAKRGKGQTEQKASAQLSRFLADGSEHNLVAKKVNEAKEQIEQIIGLTAQQFLQVMVLPQGKFRQLLLAKSDERQAILSTLFQTQIYQHIERLLKDKASVIEQSQQRFEQRKTDALADLKLDDAEDLSLAIVNADIHFYKRSSEKQQKQELKQQAVQTLNQQQILATLFTRRDATQQQYENYKLQKNDYDLIRQTINRAELAASIAPQWSALQLVVNDIKLNKDNSNKLTAELTQLDNAVLIAEQQLSQARQDSEQLDPLKIKKSQLTHYQQQLLPYQQLLRQVETSAGAYQQQLSQKHILVNEEIELAGEIKQNLSNIETLTIDVSAKADLVKQKLAAQINYDLAIKLEQNRGQLQQITTLVAEWGETVELAQNEFKQAKVSADKLEMMWFANQAAVLAAKLEVNQPCVVCGSTEHPQPAEFAEDMVTVDQDSVEQARKQQEKLRTTLTEKSTQSLSCQHDLDTKKKEIGQLEKDLTSDVKSDVEQLKNLNNGLAEKLDHIELQQQQLAHQKQQSEHNTIKYKELLAKLKSVDEALFKLNSEHVVAQSQLENIGKDLPEQYRDAKIVDSILRDISNKIITLEGNVKAKSICLTEALTQQAAGQSRLKQLTIDADLLISRQQSAVQKWQQQLHDAQFSQQQFEQESLSMQALSEQRKQVVDYDNLLQKLFTEIKLLDEQLHSNSMPDLDLLKLHIEQANVQLLQVENDWLESQQLKTKLADIKHKIAAIENEQISIKQQYEVVGILSKVASGHSTVRVSLERFVLGNILDSVLRIASQRLYMMSKGQYRLIRQNEASQKKNITAGLDLAVDDSHTGKVRPVSTLSGGESFLASLALALALSDVVQERSGGIQLDTLFIDEGFGSLDSESLQLAINTLIDLQATGRTIGIISHVTELKEQMALRIDVSATMAGSSIKLQLK